MAQKFLTAIDLNGNQLLNVGLQALAAAPSAYPGRIYYDTALATARVYNGVTSAWVNLDPTKAPLGSIPLNLLVTDPLARANHTGSQTASTISDLAAVVKAYKLSDFAGPTTAVSFNTQELTNLGTPTAGTSATTKTYVDNAVANAKAGLDVKDSVRVASTASLTLSGIQTVDGVALSVGDRILAKDQATGNQRLIYIVQSGAWTIAPDSANGYLTPEAFVFVEEGTQNGASQWRVTTTGTITVGTTSVTWTQFGGGVTYTQGNGITISGTTVSVNVVAGGGITVGGSGIQVDRTLVPMYKTITIGDGSQTSFTVTHNLNNQRPQVTVYEASTNAAVIVDIVASTVNTLTISVAVAPPANGLIVAVVG